MKRPIHLREIKRLREDAERWMIRATLAEDRMRPFECFGARVRITRSEHGWSGNVGATGVVRSIRSERDGTIFYGIDGPAYAVDDDQFYYATRDMFEVLEENPMSDKPKPVCAPMTTFTPVSDAVDATVQALRDAKPALLSELRKDLAERYPIPGVAGAPAPTSVPGWVDYEIDTDDVCTLEGFDGVAITTGEIAAQSGIRMSRDTARVLGYRLLGIVSATAPTGTEADLQERWDKLLIAESRLQESRQQIRDSIEQSFITLGTSPEGRVSIPAVLPEVLDRLDRFLDEQEARPSPDFRNLLINVRKQAIVLNEKFTKKPAPDLIDVRAPLKELLRLTAVERLEPWIGSFEERTMRKAYDDAIQVLVAARDGHDAAAPSWDHEAVDDEPVDAGAADLAGGAPRDVNPG